MLESITLENFKIFEKVTIEPGLITVFIGPNGTGKSSVFQGLALIKQSLNRPSLTLDGPLVSGDFKDFLRRPLSGADAAIIFDLMVGIDEPIGEFFPHTGRLTYRAEFKDSDRAIYEARVETDGHVFLSGRSSYDEPVRPTEPQHFTAKDRSVRLRFQTGNSFGRPFAVIRESGPPNIQYEQEATRFCAVLSDVLEHVYIVPALRGFEQLAYKQLPGPVAQADIAMLWPTYEQRAIAVATILLQRRDIEEKVSGWIARVTERTVGWRVAQDYHVALETSDLKNKFNIVHDGFGTSQLVYLFTQTALVPPNSLICVDEPEIHLHPKAQAALSSVLARIAKETPQQLVLSTHSEHMLMGLLTTVAEGKLKPEELAVYYFSRTEDGTRATAERLEVNNKGQIKGGLRGFFETDIEELDRYLKARFEKAQ